MGRHYEFVGGTKPNRIRRQDESGTKTCLLNFQIQVPPHEDTQILNIVVYRDDHQESTISTDDSNLKMVFGNPKHGIKVAVSKQQNM